MQMADIAGLNKSEERLIEEFKDRLLERLKDKIVLIRLFGSKARGSSQKESDIDLLVVLKGKNRETDDIIIDLELELMDKYNYRSYLSTLTFDQVEFNRLNDLKTNFMLNVAEEGVNL